jgi:hypothetical protein
MHYVAELSNSKGALATTDFEAKDDADAKQKAEQWAVPQLSETIGEITRLQVVQGARGVHSKNYGQMP